MMALLYGMALEELYTYVRGIISKWDTVINHVHLIFNV